MIIGVFNKIWQFFYYNHSKFKKKSILIFPSIYKVVFFVNNVNYYSKQEVINMIISM